MNYIDTFLDTLANIIYPFAWFGAGVCAGILIVALCQAASKPSPQPPVMDADDAFDTAPREVNDPIYQEVKNDFKPNILDY